MTRKRKPAVIAGVYNTVQARRLPGETSRTLLLDAVAGVLADAGVPLAAVDGLSAGGESAGLIYDLGLGPCWQGSQFGVSMVLEAAAAIETGQVDTVLIAAADAGTYTDRAATAPWTRPENEFVVPWGLFTAAEFALVARRHMITYGTTSEQLATVAATIRNNGHANPAAVYVGRGPFTAADVLASRMVADPFHLLDCSMTAEGGCALLLTTAERAADLPRPSIQVLGGGADHFGPSYRFPPPGTTAAVPAPWSTARSADEPSSGHCTPADYTATTSTSWSCTTPSRSRSSASWRRSVSVARERAARSSRTAASRSTAATR
nr:thiolase family protein [Parafrankia sp. CH37]